MKIRAHSNRLHDHSKRTKEASMIGTQDTSQADKTTPKSIIVYRGEVGASVRGLMHEWRRVFMPWSSAKLHGKNKSLRDYLSVASTFGVSHLQLFTAPLHGTVLRVMRFYNGPTLTFRVTSFTLRNEIVSAQRHPVRLNNALWQVAPIVVLNNFAHPSLHNRAQVGLLEATFRAMFPSVNIHTAKPSSFQRIVLAHYDQNIHVVQLRHYYIDARATGLSKTVKKLLQNRRPNKLGNLESIDNVLATQDNWSDTDGEGEQVTLTQPFRAHKDRCRLKLKQIGPRLTLQLIKVENGFASGQVIYHRTIIKPLRQVQLNAAKVHARSSLKAQRKAVQEANVNHKQQAVLQKQEQKRARREAAMRDQEQNPFETTASTFAATSYTNAEANGTSNIRNSTTGTHNYSTEINMNEDDSGMGNGYMGDDD